MFTVAGASSGVNDAVSAIYMGYAKFWVVCHGHRITNQVTCICATPKPNTIEARFSLRTAMDFC
jgi:hypothetical protein